MVSKISIVTPPSKIAMFPTCFAKGKACPNDARLKLIRGHSCGWLIAHPHLLVWVIIERRVPTLVATSGCHWLNKVSPTGGNRSLVARTNKCGWAITPSHSWQPPSLSPPSHEAEEPSELGSATTQKRLNDLLLSPSQTQPLPSPACHRQPWLPNPLLGWELPNSPWSSPVPT